MRMKILIISDDSAFINTIDSYFQKRGHSSIIYKWLIKAMDNLEEIKPEVIIVSADEYPRHWKSLVQFMESGIAGKEHKIYLYKKEKIEGEEELKIQKLNIAKVFDNLDSITLNTTFAECFPKTQQAENIENKETTSETENSLIITNPGTHNFVYGKYSFINEKAIKFSTNDEFYLPKINEYIEKLSYRFNNKLYSTSGKILNVAMQEKTKIVTIEI